MAHVEESLSPNAVRSRGAKSVSRSHLSLDRRFRIRHQLHPLPRHQALVVGDLLAHPGLRRMDRRPHRPRHPFRPHLFSILHEAPASSIHYAFLWGALWGIGSLTFGLAIRYLGLALGYAIALGLCTA